MRADRQKIERLLKTARGQMDGLLRMVEEDRYCIDISNQIMAAQAILKNANREILKAHLSGCVREAFEEGGDAPAQKVEEIVSVFDKLTK